MRRSARSAVHKRVTGVPERGRIRMLGRQTVVDGDDLAPPGRKRKPSPDVDIPVPTATSNRRAGDDGGGARIPRRRGDSTGTRQRGLRTTYRRRALAERTTHQGQRLSTRGKPRAGVDATSCLCQPGGSGLQDSTMWSSNVTPLS